MSGNDDFYFSFNSNKLNDMKKMQQFIDLNNVTYIVEPFCGACSFSRYCCSEFDFSGKIILNDTDEILMKFLNFVKKNSSLKIVEYYNDFIKTATETKIIEEIKYRNENVFSYFVYRKFNDFCLVKPFANKMNPIDHSNFIQLDKFFQDENIELYNSDAFDIIKSYNNKNTFIFFDPPHFQNNSQIKKVTCKDSTEIFITIKNMRDNYLSKILSSLNSDSIMRYIFSGYIEYE
jgi:site-specific DNA-adenine methylase